MGIIQRQALRNTIINFAGASIGGLLRIITPLVAPSNSIVGLMSALDSVSATFAVLFNMGYIQVLYRIFPKFRDSESGHHGFLLLGVFMSLIGILISWVIFYFFGHYLVNTDTDIVLFRKFAFLIFPMIFFRIIFVNIDAYIRMLYYTFAGVFLDTFLSKVLMVISMLLYVYLMISLDQFIYLYALTFCFPGLLVIIFAFVKTEKIVMPSRELRSPQERRRINEYIVFGLLTGASGSIVLYIDQLMITRMLSFEMMAIYSVLFFAARFMLIPSTGIARIAQVVVSDAWERDDLTAIRDIYEKSCVNQLLIGAFMLGVGIAIIGPVLSLHPKYGDYLAHTYVFSIIGSGLLFEMATGINLVIITSSGLYRYNLYFNIVVAIMAIVLNYFFIDIWQLWGASVASALMIIIMNLLRSLLLYKRYRLWPFKRAFAKALVLSLVFLVACSVLDYEAGPWTKIILNTILLSVVFWGLVMWLRLSTDINKWLLKMKNKFF